MGRAQVGYTPQRVPASGGGNGSSTSSAAIPFRFTANTFIPRASSSLQIGSDAYENPTAPFAKPGVYTRALYREGNQVRGTERSKQGRGGNGDENGVGVGNGDGNGHGDGDGYGAGTGRGVEASERTQDGNGDGSGDESGNIDVIGGGKENENRE